MNQENVTQQLLKQIETLPKKYNCDEDYCEMVHMLLSKLRERIEMSDQLHKSRIKVMRTTQEHSFAELLKEKNVEITGLRMEVDRLNSDLKRISRPKSLNEPDVRRLKEELKKRNDEINEMTYKLIDAQSQITSLEKEKYSTKPQLDASDLNAKMHFKTIKKALLSNRNFLHLMKMKNMLTNSQISLSDTEF